VDGRRDGQIVCLFFIGKLLPDIRPEASLNKVLRRTAKEVVAIIPQGAKDGRPFGRIGEVLGLD